MLSWYTVHKKVSMMKGVMSIHSARTQRNITRIILFMPVNLQELIVGWGSSIGGYLQWQIHLLLECVLYVYKVM
jgi:hypothetical protein